MNFSQHALDKLEIYGISKIEILEGCKSPLYEFFDIRENSKVVIINVKNILLALVISINTDNLITIYRTDEKTIINRRKAKRWI